MSDTHRREYYHYVYQPEFRSACGVVLGDVLPYSVFTADITCPTCLASDEFKAAQMEQTLLAQVSDAPPRKASFEDTPGSEYENTCECGCPEGGSHVDGVIEHLEFCKKEGCLTELCGSCRHPDGFCSEHNNETQAL